MQITTLDWPGLLIGVILPILVGVVTKSTTPSGVKAVLLLLFTAVNGFVVELVNGGGFHWGTALFTWGGSFLIAVATHFGFYKPTNISLWAQNLFVTPAAPIPAGAITEQEHMRLRNAGFTVAQANYLAPLDDPATLTTVGTVQKSAVVALTATAAAVPFPDLTTAANAYNALRTDVVNLNNSLKAGPNTIM